MTNELDKDARWRRLFERPWTCSTCGNQHVGLMDFASNSPDQWTATVERAENCDLDLTGNFLSDDFCVLDGKHFFVRAVLNLPILGSGDQSFGYGVWSSLSRDHFDVYIDTFDAGEQDNLGPWFGWFSNSLKGYPETLNLKCMVHPVGGRRRPLVELEPIDHPLALEQRNGVSFDRVLDLYAINGHDIRPSLVD